MKKLSIIIPFLNEQNTILTILEKIVSLAKRRGFIGPSSEMYGGFASGYDYGFLGVELKNNVKKAWWHDMVQMRDNIIGLDQNNHQT